MSTGRGRFGAALAGLLLALVACEEVVDDRVKSPPPVGEPPAEPSTYVGYYGGTAGQTTVNLEVEPEVFSAAVYVEERSATAGTLHAASASAAVPGSWYLLQGTAESEGSKVTLTVEAVRVGLGLQPVEGEALAVYKSCDISGTAGDAFVNEVLADIVECVGADGAAGVTAYQSPKRPSELIRGTWEADLSAIWGPDSGLADLLMVVAVGEKELSYSFTFGQLCDVPTQDHHHFGNDLNLEMDRFYASVVEGEVVILNLVLTRVGDGDDGSRVVVDWNTKPGDAQAGADYVAYATSVSDEVVDSGRLYYTGGTVVAQGIKLAALEDDEVEGYEIFFVELEPAEHANHSIGWSSRNVVVIRDDDGAEAGSGACVVPAAQTIFHAAEVGDTVIDTRWLSTVETIGGYEETRSAVDDGHETAISYVIDAAGNRAAMNIGGIDVWFDRRVP